MALLTCAQCGKRERKTVVYGYPSPGLLAEAERGEVVLGGCCLGTPMDGWLCDRCRSESSDVDLPGEVATVRPSPKPDVSPPLPPPSRNQVARMVDWVRSQFERRAT